MRKQSKRIEAAERNAKWANLSPRQQMDALDKRLGKGVGANKQRARIRARIISNDGVDSLPLPLRLAIAYGVGPEKLKEILENPNVDSDK